jgi:hypothetical protein
VRLQSEAVLCKQGAGSLLLEGTAIELLGDRVGPRGSYSDWLGSRSHGGTAEWSARDACAIDSAAHTQAQFALLSSCPPLLGRVQVRPRRRAGCFCSCPCQTSRGGRRCSCALRICPGSCDGPRPLARPLVRHRTTTLCLVEENSPVNVVADSECLQRSRRVQLVFKGRACKPGIPGSGAGLTETRRNVGTTEGTVRGDQTARGRLVADGDGEGGGSVERGVCRGRGRVRVSYVRAAGHLGFPPGWMARPEPTHRLWSLS